MKVCATCKTAKPVDEFHRKADAKDGRHPSCKHCRKIENAARRTKNIDAAREYDHERQSTPKRLALARNQYVKHKPKRIAAMAVYAKEHPEIGRKAKRAYKQRNPAKTLSDTRRRQARKLNATPAWANQFFIEEIYDLARRRTEATGFKWHVDHIVPLQHPLVQGLRCEQNLQVIPAVTNYSKGNRTWPNMPA